MAWTPNRVLSLAATGTAALLLAACQTISEPDGGNLGASDPAPVIAAPKPVTTGPVRVALLLPLSGPHAELGANLRRAALSLDGSNDNIVVQSYDTQGTVEGTLAAYDQAGPVDAVIGPVFSVNTKALGEAIAFRGPVAQRFGTGITGRQLASLSPQIAQGISPDAASDADGSSTPIASPTVQPVSGGVSMTGPVVFSLSNDQIVAGGAVRLMGYRPQPQTERVLSYLASTGKRTVALLAPDTAYSRLVSDQVKQMAARGQVSLAQESLYAPGTTYNDVAELTRQAVRGSGANVIMIPATGLDLVGISSLVQYYVASRDAAVIAGTNLWEGAKLEKEASLHGAVFASTATGEIPPAADLGGVPPMAPLDTDTASPDGVEGPIGATETDAASPDGVEGPIGATETDAVLPPPPPPPSPREPDQFEKLAMDSLAVVKAWSGRPGSTEVRAPLAEWIARDGGFRGAAGLFRFKSDGLVERAYNIVVVSRTGLTSEDAAPRAFPGARTAVVTLDQALIPPPGVTPRYIARPEAPQSAQPGTDRGPVTTPTTVGTAPAPAVTSAPSAGGAAPPLRTGEFRPSWM